MTGSISSNSDDRIVVDLTLRVLGGHLHAFISAQAPTFGVQLQAANQSEQDPAAQLRYLRDNWPVFALPLETYSVVDRLQKLRNRWAHNSLKPSDVLLGRRLAEQLLEAIDALSGIDELRAVHESPATSGLVESNEIGRIDEEIRNLRLSLDEGEGERVRLVADRDRFAAELAEAQRRITDLADSAASLPDVAEASMQSADDLKRQRGLIESVTRQLTETNTQLSRRQQELDRRQDEMSSRLDEKVQRILDAIERREEPTEPKTTPVGPEAFRTISSDEARLEDASLPSNAAHRTVAPNQRSRRIAVVAAIAIVCAAIAGGAYAVVGRADGDRTDGREAAAPGSTGLRSTTAAPATSSNTPVTGALPPSTDRSATTTPESSAADTTVVDKTQPSVSIAPETTVAATDPTPRTTAPRATTSVAPTLAPITAPPATTAPTTLPPTIATPAPTTPTTAAPTTVPPRVFLPAGRLDPYLSVGPSIEQIDIAVTGVPTSRSRTSYQADVRDVRDASPFCADFPNFGNFGGYKATTWTPTSEGQPEVLFGLVWYQNTADAVSLDQAVKSAIAPCTLWTTNGTTYEVLASSTDETFAIFRFRLFQNPERTAAYVFMRIGHVYGFGYIDQSAEGVVLSYLEGIEQILAKMTNDVARDVPAIS